MSESTEARRLAQEEISALLEKHASAIGPFDRELVDDGETAGPNTVLAGWVLVACWHDLEADEGTDDEWTTRLDSARLPRSRRRGLLYEALEYE